MGSNYAVQQLQIAIEAALNSVKDDHVISNRCISRVPQSIREANEHAFTPMVISLGPYHNKDQRLSSMEFYKLNYLKSFLFHTRDNADLTSYVKILFENESMLKKSHADSVSSLNRQTFMGIVLIDGIFILELFRRCSNPLEIKDDPLLGSVTINQVFRDILLIENQLPFFILKKLYYQGFGKQFDDGKADRLTVIACKFLRISCNEVRVHSVTNEAICCHLLDLFRSHYRPSNETATKIVHSVTRTPHFVSPTVSLLQNAAVKFQVAKTYASSNLLDISFDEQYGILTIPKLTMDQEPNLSVFKNMIAFEQSDYPFNTATYLLDYCYFLDCLIRTPKGVEVLAHAGVVEDYRLGCDVLCDMFSSVTKNIYRTSSWSYYYAGLSKQLISWCDKSRHRYDDMTILEIV